MNPLLIFFVLLFLGAMFLIGNNPETHEVKKENTVNAAQTMDHLNHKDNDIGEE